MNVRLITGGALLLCAALLNAQSDERKAPADERQAAASAATQEAARQGTVALKPNAQQSRAQTMQQAIAFERYKDLAAEREARKESGASNSATSETTAKPKHTMAMAKRKR